MEDTRIEQDNTPQPEHKRRVRYSGKYPKKFSEKYKELNPEKYGEEIAHVLAKGNTPAGTHIPIMVQEINGILQVKPGEVGVDCTLGYGGHTRSFLDALQGRGHLYSCDIDALEFGKTVDRLRKAGYGEDLWTPVQMNFSDIDILAQEVGGFDFVLADLGVSSMQIDNPERGFTYKAEGPLDLRMNPESGIPAWQRLLELTKGELAVLLEDNGDEPYAEEIADQIVSSLHRGVAIVTTRALYREVEQALLKVNMGRGERKEMLKKSAARVFQSLRIDVNGEFDALLSLMQKLPGALKPGGRAAILTFHSGEDRIVKKAFKELWKAGVYSQVARDVIRAGKEECYANSRAKPAKLRWAVKPEVAYGDRVEPSGLRVEKCRPSVCPGAEPCTLKTQNVQEPVPLMSLRFRVEPSGLRVEKCRPLVCPGAEPCTLKTRIVQEPVPLRFAFDKKLY